MAGHTLDTPVHQNTALLGGERDIIKKKKKGIKKSSYVNLRMVLLFFFFLLPIIDHFDAI